MYMLIGADLVPTKSNIELFVSGDKRSLVGEDLERTLENASYRIFNLEVPLTNKEEPILKQGPNLIAPTNAVQGYKELGVDLLTLANNHIMDQDEQGLRATIKTLDEMGINHVGAGDNLSVAMKPFVFSFAGKKIGVYACTEHEFSIATDTSPGANPFEPLWSLEHVEDLKRRVDFIIVLYHGGKEHYQYPSPNLQKTCRRMVDKGVNLVVCQHSHCIGCEERYKDGTILYGQGNFLFDHSDNELWQTSLMVKIDENMKVTYIPLVKSGNGVRMADETRKTEIMKAFHSRSDDIQKLEFIQTQYSQLADDYLEFYLCALSGEKSLFFRIINKLLKGQLMRSYFQRTYSKEISVRIANYIDCEAHRELLSQAIRNIYKGKR